MRKTKKIVLELIGSPQNRWSPRNQTTTRRQNVPKRPKSDQPYPIYEQEQVNLKYLSQNSKEKPSVSDLLDFYCDIPEYDDVHHLSNKEFYSRLDSLKEKQKNLQNSLQSDTWVEDYKTLSISEEKKAKKSNIKSRSSTKLSKYEDDVKPPSRRSVRIESPGEEDLHLPLELDLEVPPEWKNEVTGPKPFQMTVRDEENKIVEQVLLEAQKPTKSELFKAHTIPLESQIPLYDKLVAEQKRKNFLVRERRKADLQAQMRPFSFTKRDEDLQALSQEISKLCCNDKVEQSSKFKAKPVPKNLFSNYVYRRMNEDEFFRTLQKKIRAEEMLKAASLPPSMAKRERSVKKKYDVCPKWYKEIYCCSLNDKANNCNNNKARKSRSTSALSSLDVLPITNRQNLAALLRIQSARKRMEMEVLKKLEENRVKSEIRWKEKLFRQRPVWNLLDYSHEEDLLLRLQLRRDEDRLRQQEHKILMRTMLGRVREQPTLFERQGKYAGRSLLNKLYLQESSRKRSLSDMSDFKSQSTTKEHLFEEHKEKDDEEAPSSCD